MDFISDQEVELKFYPEYNKMEWSEEWIGKFGNYLNHSYNVVTEYVPETDFPEIVFVQKQYVAEIIKKVGLPKWVNAFTLQKSIYILFDDKNLRWRSIIDHEMFHVRINIFLGENKLPDWFNEGIAYFIGKNSEIDIDRMYKYVADNYEIVYGWIEKDQLLSKSDIGFDITKSLGAYICKAYGAKKIRSFLEEIKKSNHFKAALNNTLGTDVPELVNKWRNYLFQKMYQ